jgi:hypothetical protein
MYTYRIGWLPNDSLFGNSNHSPCAVFTTDAIASCAPSFGFRTAALALRADRQSSNLGRLPVLLKIVGGEF